MVCPQPGAQVPAVLPKRIPLRTRSVDFCDGHVLGGPGPGAGDLKGEESIPMTPPLFALLAAPRRPQAPPPAVARLYDGPLTSVERQLVGLAEAMPADK